MESHHSQGLGRLRKNNLPYGIVDNPVGRAILSCPKLAELLVLG